MLSVSAPALVSERERGVDDVQESLRDLGRRREVLDVLAENDELIATDPGDGIGLAGGRLQASGGFDQDVVTHVVPDACR